MKNQFIFPKEYHVLVKKAGTIDPSDGTNREELKRIITKMGKMLMISGLPSDKISLKIRRSIERQYKKHFEKSIKLSQIWYYDLMKKNKWPEVTKIKKKPILNIQETGFAISNQEVITAIDIMIRSVSEFRQYLMGHPYTELVPKESLDQLIIMVDSASDNLANYMNERHVIPNQSMLIFWNLYNQCAGMTSLFNMFFDEIRVSHLKLRNVGNKAGQIMTKKEVQQVLSRKLVNINKILDFDTPNEAILCGFSGQQCPNCSGFRTIPAEGSGAKMVCISCRGKRDYKSFIKQVIFQCGTCRFLLNTKDQVNGKVKCRSCEKEQYIPEEFQYGNDED